MPFIRHARDKRGYETTFVMHAYRAGNGSSRTRVLYVFRSPSGLKVGRRALEPEVVEALEHTHPDLTFDWALLLREPAAPPRVDVRERWQRPGRSGGSGARTEQSSKPEVAQPPPPVVEDESLLGRTLGAREAARLRERYQELLQRITRRARTPEDRDRLTERAHRLNPEDWTDEAVIRAAVSTVDAEWGAIAAELPSRRRGRRGGRFRGDQVEGGSSGPTAETDGQSGIITGEGEGNEEPLDAVEHGPVGPNSDDSAAGDSGGFRADAAAPADHPSSSGAPDAAVAPGADEPGVPRRDGDHLD